MKCADCNKEITSKYDYRLVPRRGSAKMFDDDVVCVKCYKERMKPLIEFLKSGEEFRKIGEK